MNVLVAPSVYFSGNGLANGKSPFKGTFLFFFLKDLSFSYGIPCATWLRSEARSDIGET